MKFRKILKPFSAFVLFTFLNQMLFPTVAFALTGGPTQPEVHGFEPVGTNQMVDLFSGDFTYNVPLFEIGGYPINMAYHSGVGMEQEASWVGLGWSLTPGAINRNLRGLPDDFDGEEIKFKRKIRTNQTIGLNVKPDPESFGFEFGKKLANGSKKRSGKFSLNLGVTYNNYTGIDINRSASVSLTNSMINPTIGYSDNGGLSFSAKPNLASLLKKKKNEAETGTKDNGKLMSFQPLDAAISWSSSSGLGMSVKGGANASGKLFGKKAAYSANFNTDIISSEKVYSPGSDVSMWNFGIRLNVANGTDAYGQALQGEADLFYNMQKIGGFGKERKVDGDVSDWQLKAYGANYAQNASNSLTNDLLDFNREHEYPLRDESPLLPVTQITHDIFSISGQGTGGSFRDHRNDFPIVGKNKVSDVPATQLNIGLDLEGGGLFKIGGNASV